MQPWCRTWGQVRFIRCKVMTQTVTPNIFRLGQQVKGEYGLSETLLGAGYNLATLMARYAPSTDWREKRHWHCNNNVHPSRHGTYDGISMHPFETMFVKARCAPAA